MPAKLAVDAGEALRLEEGRVAPGRTEGVLELLRVSGVEPSPFSMQEADACMVATDASEQVVGFVQGFARGDTLFVCQICVHPTLRRCGLATRMMDALAAVHGAAHVEASVTPADTELRDTIRHFAMAHHCPCTVAGKWQLEERFPTSRRALTQFLYRVGPLVHKDHLEALTPAYSRL
uniref:N-acetyltransferase domain-containing protein n=1 Tax=Alexandrium catenella TaxID=2925 RepID=A0A7S1WK11_ALECA